jgi:hypothetical protein
VAVQIVFTDSTRLRVKHPDGAADLARVLSGRDHPAYAGDFLYLEKTPEGHAWVNPHTVAYLEDWPD